MPATTKKIEIKKVRKALYWVKMTELKKKNTKIATYKKSKKQLHKKFKAYLRVWLALVNLLK